MNKKTKALTTEQYKEIIQTMKEGFCGCRPNERIATALVLEGNLGLRISDIVKLRPCDIVRDGDRYRLEIVEQKTGKRRVFTVPLVIAQYVENYCLRNGIAREDLIFPITERAVQKQLAIVCDYLGFEGISTHSFRKWYATEIYKANGYDIALVQRLLQHSSAAVTQRYIGIEPQRIEAAIQGHAQLLMSAPLLSSKLAHVCRRSWGETSGKPADFTKRLMCFVTAFGSRGSNGEASEGNTKAVVRTVFGWNCTRSRNSCFNSWSVLAITGIVRTLFAVFGSATMMPLSGVYVTDRLTLIVAL